MPRLFAFALPLCLLLVQPLAMRAQSQADLLARLTAARDATNLTDPSLKPWHMVASFELLDAQGAVTEHGTFEECWASPDRWKSVYTTPASTSTTIQDGEKSFRMKDAPIQPMALQLVETQLINPLANDYDLSRSQAIEQPRTVGQITLNCTMLETARSTSDPPAPLFLYPTACFDTRAVLRILSVGGAAVLERTKTGTFQGKSVAIGVAVMEGPNPIARGSVTQLATFTPSDGDFSPASDLQQRPSSVAPYPKLGSGVVAGFKTGGEPPHYPAYAKEHHLSGSVVLQALIGPDGHVAALQPMSWPSPSLADAAMQAVRTWTYKPYLLNGVPTSVQTTITVNFRFG